MIITGAIILYAGTSLGFITLVSRSRVTLFTSFALGAVGFGLIVTGLI